MTAAVSDATVPAIDRKLHLRRIDVLRGIAILAVLLLHWYGAAFGVDHLQWKGMVRDFASAPGPWFWVFYPLSYGWMGVSLFFVISGFCIHASTLQAGELKAGKFFWRRFWRICPPYFAWLAFFAWRSGLGFSTAEDRAQILSHVFLFYNFGPAWIFAISGAFWSLAVEAQLYLLYPLLWTMRRQWSTRGALVGTLAISLATRVIAAIFFTDWNKEFSGTVWTFPTMLWFDWALGAYLAEEFLSGRRAFPRSILLRIAAFLVLLLSVFWKPGNALAFSLSSCALVLLVESYLWRDKGENLLERLLVPLGLCSYSLYLLHYPFVPDLLHRLPIARGLNEPWHAIVLFPIAFAILFAAAYVSYLTLERGSIRVGRILWPTTHNRAWATHAAP
jgi:peptidoglycan/LPS O-acetylase OafA/YrhL